MPEYLKAFIVVFSISTIILIVVRPTFGSYLQIKEYNRRANLWIVITTILFLSNSFWIYLIGSAVAIQVAKKSEVNHLSLFVMLLFVTPVFFSVEIPGFGVINYLFELNHLRLLELLVLLPVAITLSAKSDTSPFGSIGSDRFLVGYVILTTLLLFRDASLTGVMREGFYAVIDILLPYYVFSRLLKNMEDFRDTIGTFVLASTVLAGLGIFENIKHWLLYSAVMANVGVSSGMGLYLERSDSIRAMASAGHSIVFGFILMVAIGFYSYLLSSVPKRLINHLVTGVLLMGLYVSLSRGPWLGTLVFVVVFYLYDPNRVRGISKLVIGGMVAVLFVLILPGGDKLLDILPFIGSEQTGSVTYRQELFDKGMILIQQSPWLGAADFLDTPEMQSMIQGQGIIDIVNSYLAIALKNGLIGLGLFVGFFLSVILEVKRVFRYSIKAEYDKNEYFLGVTLFSLLLAIMVSIATVSSIMVIPIVYWAIAGMAVGYVQMLQREQTVSGSETLPSI